MTLLDFCLVTIVPFLASILTFFSGFGLGTILLPVFMVLFPIEIAVAMTALVHLLNNIFKLFLVGKKADVPVTLKFGVPALFAALIGAWCLSFLSYQIPIFTYSLKGQSYQVGFLQLVIGAVMIFFALMELVPRFLKWTVDRKYLSLGGLLSGFFGGLSGHQGAFRSAFLLKAGLSKEAFIATGVIVACVIDLVRLFVYGFGISFSLIINQHLMLLSLAIVSAWAGAWIGRKTLHMATFSAVRWVVGISLMIFGILIAAGIV